MFEYLYFLPQHNVVYPVTVVILLSAFAYSPHPRWLCMGARWPSIFSRFFVLLPTESINFHRNLWSSIRTFRLQRIACHQSTRFHKLDQVLLPTGNLRNGFVVFRKVRPWFEALDMDYHLPLFLKVTSSHLGTTTSLGGIFFSFQANSKWPLMKEFSSKIGLPRSTTHLGWSRWGCKIMSNHA